MRKKEFLKHGKKHKFLQILKRWVINSETTNMPFRREGWLSPKSIKLHTYQGYGLPSKKTDLGT